MKGNATGRPAGWLGALASLVVASTTACSAPSTESVAATPSHTADHSPSAAPEPAATEALRPGGLEVGTRYVIESLGISVQPAEDGWFAVLPQGGDAALSREDVTVYILAPDTVLAPDGTQIPAPGDPQELLDAIDASAIVAVRSTEPFSANAVSGLSAEVTGSGGHVPLMTTGSRSYGLADGQFQLIVIEVDGRALVVSIERPDAPDIDAAWEVAGPLVESLDVAE